MSSNPHQALPVVGFIGIGKMGLPMVEHLRRAGYSINVYDLLPANALQVRSLVCTHKLKSVVNHGPLLISSCNRGTSGHQPAYQPERAGRNSPPRPIQRSKLRRWRWSSLARRLSDSGWRSYCCNPR